MGISRRWGVYNLSHILEALDAIERYYGEVEGLEANGEIPGFVSYMTPELVGVVKEGGVTSSPDPEGGWMRESVKDYYLAVAVPSQVEIPTRVWVVLQDYVLPYVRERVEGGAIRKEYTLADARRLLAKARRAVADPNWHYRAICEHHLAHDPEKSSLETLTVVANDPQKERAELLKKKATLEQWLEKGKGDPQIVRENLASIEQKLAALA